MVARDNSEKQFIFCHYIKYIFDRLMSWLTNPNKLHQRAMLITLIITHKYKKCHCTKCLRTDNEYIESTRPIALVISH